MVSEAMSTLLPPGTVEIGPKQEQVKKIPVPDSELHKMFPSVKGEIKNIEKVIPLPTSVDIQSLLDSRLRLRTFITLIIDKEEDFYVVKCNEFWKTGFGYGKDPIEAIDDFRQALAELYWALKQEQPKLAPSLAADWQELQKVIYEA